MRIDPHVQNHGFSRRARSLLRRPALVLIAILVVAAGMFGLGAWVHKQGVIGPTLIRVRELASLPVVYYFRGLTSNPPHLVIDMQHMDLQTLAYNREIALRRGRLLYDARDEVPATVRLGDRTVPVRIRLKGDLVDHWGSKHQWSFRIKVRGEDSINGMREFSIQHPRTRDYMNEWFFHRFLSYSGLTTLRYDFVEVTLNGRYLGIYGREEHFDKLLIENNGQREGVLFRADTRFYWYDKPGNADYVFGAALQPYQPRGERATHEVFDADKLATLFAVLDLTGHHHAAHLQNLVFYWNPITSLIEPVPADNQYIIRATKLIGASKGIMKEASAEPGGRTNWFELAFSDPVFFEKYVRALERVADDDVLSDFFESTHEEFEQQLRILHKGFPWYSLDRSKSILRSNQRYIREHLSPKKSFQAYYAGFDSLQSAILLEIASVHTMPVVMEGGVVGDSLHLSQAGTGFLPSYSADRPLSYRRYALSVPQAVTWADSMVADLRLCYRILGASERRDCQVIRWRPREELLIDSDIARKTPNASQFSFLDIHPERGEIRVRPGTWRVSRDVIIPAGYRMLCGEGVEIDLVEEAMLYSYSPFEFLGSEERPIVIRSSDGTGQGLVILSARMTSRFKHVRFVGLSSPCREGWELSGAITLFESPVEFSNCEFLESYAEDGLNIVRSRFIIEECLFARTASDALDVDFGEGQITATSFVECGNDGLDVSGSTIEAQDLFINFVGDKALSVGEMSRFRVTGLTVRNAEIAVASKDESEFSGEEIFIHDTRVGLTAYQKKTEFGRTSLFAEGTVLENVEQGYLVERGSAVRVNGEWIPDNFTRVEEMLYGAGDGKSSR
jgi:hypothetical protein